MTDNAAAVAAKPPAAKGGSRGLNVAIGACAVLAVLGIVLWVVQLSGGMIQTAMRNLDSWGLYITLFMFFVGLSAGGLIISSVPKAFGIRGFGGISKVAVMSSIAATVAAIAFVVVDLGQPVRMWELFAYSNLGSPLMWDIIVLMTYLILSCVYLWAQVRNERGKVSHTALRVISVVALVCAVLVHSVTAWIFGLQQSHETPLPRAAARASPSPSARAPCWRCSASSCGWCSSPAAWFRPPCATWTAGASTSRCSCSSWA